MSRIILTASAGITIVVELVTSVYLKHSQSRKWVRIKCQQSAIPEDASEGAWEGQEKATCNLVDAAFIVADANAESSKFADSGSKRLNLFLVASAVRIMKAVRIMML